MADRIRKRRFLAQNLLADLPDAAAGEVTEALVRGSNVRIERIVSRGQASPPGFWYDQGWDEWVVVLKGRAALRFEGQPDVVAMGPGDWMNIPAHIRHRVERTEPGQDTVWLAVHWHEELRGFLAGIDTDVPREEDREL